MNDETAALVGRLAALDSNLVSDVLDAAGLPGHVLAPGVAALDPGRALAGVALCARGVNLAEHGKPARALTLFDIDSALFPGAVVILENGGAPDSALIGGFVARGWQAAGAAGMVSDGLVRDSREIVEMAFPLFASGTTPAASGGRWALVSVGEGAELPARGGGRVQVRDGDLVIGDADGVSVIPCEHADAIVAAAETLKAIEGRITAMLRAGRSRKEAFAANPRFEHVPKLG